MSFHGTLVCSVVTTYALALLLFSINVAEKPKLYCPGMRWYDLAPYSRGELLFPDRWLGCEVLRPIVDWFSEPMGSQE